MHNLNLSDYQILNFKVFLHKHYRVFQLDILVFKWNDFCFSTLSAASSFAWSGTLLDDSGKILGSYDLRDGGYEIFKWACFLPGGASHCIICNLVYVGNDYDGSHL